MNSRIQNVNSILDGLHINEGKKRENFVDMGLDKDEVLPYIYRCIEFNDEDEAQTKMFYYKGNILGIKNGKSNPALRGLEQDIKKVKSKQDEYDIMSRLEMITMW